MSYHIYENWQAGPPKAVIHCSSCPYCNNGLGRSNGDYDRAHGEWHGPYDDLDAAQKAQRRMRVVERRERHYCMRGAN